MFNQEEEQVVLPKRTQATPPLQDEAARMKAYYGAYLKKSIASSQNVIDMADQYNTYSQIHTDLTTKGTSPDLEEISSHIELQDSQQQKEALLGVVSDPAQFVETKLQAVEQSKQYKFNLAKAYSQKVAAEDKSVTNKDFQAQEKNITNYFQRNKNAIEDLQKTIYTFAGSKNITGANFVASMGRSFIPGYTGLVYANGFNALLGKESISENATNFVLTGSAMRDMGKTWANWSVEQKQEGLNRFIAWAEKSNITDPEAIEMLKTIVENPDQPGWVTALGNAGGILDATMLGIGIKAPVKTVKGIIDWFTTYNKAGDVKAYNTVKGWVTGKGVVKADVAIKGAQEVANQSAAIQAMSRQEVHPNTPLGKEITNNPDKATETAMTAVLDDTGTIAKSVTGEAEGRGQILQTTALPKTVSLDESIATTAPDIAEKINIAARALNDENIINPALYNDALQKTEVAKVLHTIKQINYPSLHLNKTLVDAKFGDTTYIKAVYGESPSHGWLNEADAVSALAKLQRDVPDVAKHFKIEYSNRNQEYFIIRDMEKKFDPNVIIGDTSATFQIPFTKKEINIDALARTKYINWVLPSSSRIANGLHSSAMATEMGVAKRVADLNKYLHDFILNKSDVFPDLNKELRIIQEREIPTWKNVDELLHDKHHLSKKQKDDLVEAYYATKALGDNFYEVANRRHRADKVAKGSKAIYKEDGTHVYGNVVKADESVPNMVWDFDSDLPVILAKDEKGNLVLNGKTLVKLETPIKDTEKTTGAFAAAEKAKVKHNIVSSQVADNRYEYALVGGKTKIGELPTYTLNKTDPYIPWYHMADFFIQRTPKQIRYNGGIISYPKNIKDMPEELKKASERIAGARTEEEAWQLIKQLKEDDPNGVYAVMKRREDIVDDIIDSHEEANRIASWEKHRGERLQGFDPLDDPIRSLAQMGKSLIKLDAWEDVDRFFKKRMQQEYGDLLPQGQIPKSPADWKILDDHAKPENLPRIAAAKREIEWYNGIFRSMVESDRAVSSVLHSMADVMNKYGTADSKILRTTEAATRDAAKQGNVFIRIPNAAATHLLLYSNILKQWVVQPQNLWTLHAMDIGFAKYGATNILPFLFATLGKSKYLEKHADEFKNIARHIGGTLSGIKGKEWDNMYDGFAKSGMLQAVDLNQMVLGLKHHDNYTLDPKVHEQIARGLSQTISAPGNLMKMVGYTPAELSNLVGGWLYSYNQYKKLHPGVDMTNPHVIEQVKAKALALTGSMAGNADVMSYQKGMWGLLFKFMPIQSKQLALMTTSKYTTKEEKLRIAVGQTVLWGAPGTVGGVYLMDAIKNNASDEDKAIITKYEGGLVDVVLNTILDTTLKHAFGIEDEKETSVAWSKTMAPFNNGVGVPAIEVFWNLYKTLTDGENAGSMRIAAWGAGSTLLAFKDAFLNRVQVQNSYETPDKVQALVEELPTLIKGWDNLAKGYMMMQTGKLVSKHGNPRQLVASHGDAFGRMFGVYTREELEAFRNIDVEKGKRAAQKALENEIFNFVMKNRQDILGMNKQYRALEYDKLLHIFGHDDPEGAAKVKGNLEKRFFFANKDLEAALIPQLQVGIRNSIQQVENAREETTEGSSLSELIDVLKGIYK